MAGCGSAAPEPGFDPIVKRRRVLTGGAALAVLVIAIARVQFTARAAGRRRTRSAVDPGPAGQRAGHRGGRGRVAAGGRRADAGRRRAHPARAGAGRPRSSAWQPDVNVSRDDQRRPPPRRPPRLPRRRWPTWSRSLRASADSAAQLAGTSSGYRAGLLGSIAASCTASYTVALAFGAARVVTSAEPSPAATPYDRAVRCADQRARRRSTATASCRRTAHPEVNTLVSSALNQHRQRRDAGHRDADRPHGDGAGGRRRLSAADAGRQHPADAARLAARMEKDTEAAWRAVIEQAQSDQDRTFAVTALTQSAVLAAAGSRRKAIGRSPRPSPAAD